MSERPAVPANLTVRTEGDEVVIEPGSVHGTVGFTLTLSRDRAKALGYALIGAATRLLPATTKTKPQEADFLLRGDDGKLYDVVVDDDGGRTVCPFVIAADEMSEDEDEA
jgi:hypothetical protein